MQWNTDLSKVPLQKYCLATVKYPKAWVDIGYFRDKVPLIETRVELGWFEQWGDDAVFWCRFFPDDLEVNTTPIQAVLAWMTLPKKYKEEKKESM